ncbi:MAG: glycosyltransferase family 4 protein, partial [Acidimicrobiia bacterium]|nr:glycosyltransferase family 4 protein [Acidimicrobiia bacterium]
MAKILHVINRFGTSGGAENQLFNNLRAFTDRSLSHSVVYIFRRDVEDPLPDVDKHGLFEVGASPRRRQIISALDDHVTAAKPDLIHCSLADAALASRVVGRRRGIPVVESLVNISHDPVRTQDNPSVNLLKLAGHRLLDRFTMRSVDHFHALTKAVAKSWMDNIGIPPEKITVIPRGIDLESIDGAASGAGVRESIGVPADAVMLLNVARQEPQKGQRYLLEAMPAILSRHPDAVAVFAGRDGNSSKLLRELVTRHDLADRVRFLGVRDDVPALLAAADVFVFPSLFEGLGVSLLEAMAAGGAACATSDAVPFDEIIDPG